MRLTAGDRAKIVALRCEGRSSIQIAELVGCHPVTVLRALRDAQGADAGALPARVCGRDGKSHPARQGCPVKACVWCEAPHCRPREFCSPQCRRERRRYRAYIARRVQV